MDTLGGAERPLRVAIVGAGPAGLTLARLLQKKQRDLHASTGKGQLLEVAVYDAYKIGNGTSEGGSLDLRQGTGLLAIEEAGLMGEFLVKARADGQDMRVTNLRGDTLYSEQSEELGPNSALFHPEIDRGDLNQLLRESLDAGTIRWETKLTKIHRLSENQPTEFKLEFANGERAVADFVVGADGAWSSVRPLLSEHEPVYSGMTFVDCVLHDFDERYPDLVDVVGNGSVYAFSHGRLIVTQRNGKGILRVYLGFKAPVDFRQASEFAACASDAERAEMLLEGHCSDWSPGFRRLVKATGENKESPNGNATNMVALPLFELPVGHSWASQAGLTLIGDAAHLMSPCAGEGVNVAMADALSLANAFVTAAKDASDNHAISREGLYAAVARFEVDMFERAKGPAAQSYRGLRTFMETGEPTCEVADRMFNRSSWAQAQTGYTQ